MALVFDGTKTGQTVTVYRLEREGLGPYSQGIPSNVWAEMATVDDRQPPPMHDDGFSQSETDILFGRIDPMLYEDNLVAAKRRYGHLPRTLLFGFYSYANLKSWFTPGELTKLLKLGFTVVEVQAVRVWDSGRQCMFEPAARSEAAA